MAFHVRGTSRKMIEGLRPLDPIKDRPEIARRELRNLLRERRKLRRAGHYLSPGIDDVIRQQAIRLLRECRGL